jgi:phospholipid-binding lipoprotein MlaA
VRRALAVWLAVLPLAAAAADDAPRRAHPADPFEGWNRGVFRFNDAVDEAVLKPVATGYRKAVPHPLRLAVGNFFGNVSDAWSAVNHFLQGKPQSGLEMTMRVATNSVFGLAGVLDVASEAGLERQQEDFGQTLGRWGCGPGPYLVLPLLGPSTLRDSFGLPLDRAASPALAFKSDADRLGLLALDLVDTRARLLDAGRLIDEIALDRYGFLRDAYLTRRRSLVYDGDPPDEPGDHDDEDDAGESVAPAPR